MKKTCNSKVEMTCVKNFAPCISYETSLPTFSKITDCANLDETTTELYTLVGEIRNQTDLTALGTKCLTYVLDSEGKKIVKNVLLKYEEKICELEAEVMKLKNRRICDEPIGACITEFRCLALPCSNTIVTFGDLLKALIAKVPCS